MTADKMPDVVTPNSAGSSEICKFYEGQNVFITGGTGFMGKILIEKLLRSTDVATIYLLIREKKGKNMHERLDELFEDLIFQKLKKERPKYKHRVVGIAGDCSVSGLGMTITDTQKLMENVNVVFHVAATVRFDENIKLAYSINVNGTKDVLELCKRIRNLKSVMHVSTAYSNCHRDAVDETFYEYPNDYCDVGAVLEKLSKTEADKITPRILGQWPNTYAFTKALAESLVKDIGNGLPIGMYRPAIVISTYKEPIEAWIDNMYGPTGVCAGAASGLLRVLHCDGSVIADIVPVDTCVAGLIAAAWDVSSKTCERTAANIPVYNYVSSVENPITWREYNTLNTIKSLEFPLSKSIWTVKFQTVSCVRTYQFLKIIYHLLPALLMDLGLFVCGYKTRMWNMYKKIHKFSDVIAFFSTRQWVFKNDNVQDLWARMGEEDRRLFPFSIRQIAWLTYFRNYLKGIRVYLIRDSMDTLADARIRLKRFDVAHAFLMLSLYFVAMTIIWNFGMGLASSFNPSTLIMATYSRVCKNSTCNF